METSAKASINVEEVSFNKQIKYMYLLVHCYDYSSIMDIYM